MDYLTTHTNLSSIRRGFAPGFVKYRKGCTRLAVACDIVYQLLAHGRWFSLGTPSSSTTKTGCHDIAEILLKMALNTKNQIKSINQVSGISAIFRTRTNPIICRNYMYIINEGEKGQRSKWTTSECHWKSI